MICLIHGYGLSGSGSNLWTQAMARALCSIGETVHLVCQEPHPEQYDFVTEAYTYAADGTVAARQVRREVPYRGGCVLHRPQLDVLPVYVHPPRGVEGMVFLPEMTDRAVDTYLERNEAVLAHVVETYGITAMHVNHLVLLSVAAQRVSERSEVPFAVMPHGSALEYVVRQDARMRELAHRALSACDLVLIQSQELRARVHTLFPDVPASKMAVMNLLGVDTEQFRPVPRGARAKQIAQLKHRIAALPRGKAQAQSPAAQPLSDALSLDELQAQLDAAMHYNHRRPDADLEEKLDAVDWAHDPILFFVGSLIGGKGLPSLIAALPPLLAQEPGLRLVVAGHGMLRELIEVFLGALAQGKTVLARNIIRWAVFLEDKQTASFDRVARYFERLEAGGALDGYFEQAARSLRPDRVLFTGYLEHDILACLFPCADVAVFPSVVAESGPFVFLEAMASGCFPIGTYFAGMQEKIDVAARALPPEAARCMKLRPDPAHTVEDIVTRVPEALKLSRRYRDALRQVAVEHYAWDRIAEKFSQWLHGLPAPVGEGRVRRSAP